MAKYVFNEEELDWIDNGHGFISESDDPWGDEVADRIISELRNAWSNENYQKNSTYEVNLSEEEIEFIYEIMYDFTIDDFISEMGENQELIGREDNENWMSLKERIDLTNGILKKFNKSIFTIEFLKKTLEIENGID